MLEMAITRNREGQILNINSDDYEWTFWVFLHWSLNFAELSLSLAKMFCLAVLLE